MVVLLVFVVVNGHIALLPFPVIQPSRFTKGASGGKEKKCCSFRVGKGNTVRESGNSLKNQWAVGSAGIRGIEHAIL